MLITLCLSLVPHGISAQQPANPNGTQPAAEVESAEVVQLKKMLEAPDLNAAERQVLDDLLRNVRSWQGELKTKQEQITTWTNRAAGAEASIQQINERLANPPAPELPSGVEAMSAGELESAFDDARDRARGGEADVQRLERTKSEIDSRETELPTSLQTAENEAANASSGDLVSRKEGDTERIAAARNLVLPVKQAAFQARVDALKTQLSTLPERKRLIAKELEMMRLELDRYKAERDAWKKVFDEKWPTLLPSVINVEWVEERRRRIAGEKASEEAPLSGGIETIAEADRTRIYAIYTKSIAKLQEAVNQQSDMQRFTEAAQSAKSTIAKLEAEAEALRINGAKPDRPADIDLMISQERGNQEILRADIEKQKQLIADFPKNKTLAATDKSKAEAKDPPVEEDMAILEGEAEQVRRAKIVHMVAYDSLLAAKIARATEQIKTSDLRLEVAKKRLDVMQVRESHMIDLLKALEDMRESMKQNDARYQASQAEQALASLASSHELVQQVAQRNVELAYKRVRQNGEAELGLLDHTKEYKDSLDSALEMHKSIESEYSSTTEMVEKVGLTNAVGKELRRRRDELPDTRDLERDLVKRAEQAESIQLGQLQIAGDRKLLDGGINKRADEILESVAGELSESERDIVRAQLLDQLRTQEEFLTTLEAEYAEFFNLLGDLDQAERNLIKLVAEYQAYIDERVLWIRSTEPFGLQDFANAGLALVWFFEPDHWVTLVTAIGDDVSHSPLIFALCLLFVSLVFFSQKLARMRIEKVSKIVAGHSGAPARMTVQAVFATLVLAAPFSLAIALFAWRLQAAMSGDEFVRAISQGLFAVAATLFTIQFARRVCRPGGLGEAHFKWQPVMLKRVRTRLFALATFLPAATGVMVALNSQSNEAYAASLGRIAFGVGALSLAWFMNAMFRPGHGALVVKPEGVEIERWRARVNGLRYVAVVGLPIALTVLAFVGFLYTAFELDMRYRATAALVIFVLIIDQVLARTFIVAVARFAQRALKRQKQLAKARQAATSNNPEGSGESSLSEETHQQHISGEAVMRQLQMLRRAIVFAAAVIGTVTIWSAVLPAFSFLNRVELWEYTAGPEGAEILKVVTLLGLIKAVGTIILTVIGARSIPGLLEATVLERLRLESGLRYAIRTLTGYVIYVIGFAMAFGYLGMQWGDVQWLVAAFSVGLGFGLQEIFANFVSGLILLFERPMQVGDVVTVNGTTGSVTRMNMRATTIRDWDYKEIVIPNKSFITGDLVNWSLNSNTLRLVFNVGVAYGSDLKKVEEKLYELAANHPDVLKDPAPMVVFHNFGDSTLDFVLRLYIPSISVYSKVQHEMFVAINNAFNEAEIEIAFPQRDINIRTQDAALLIQQAVKQS